MRALRTALACASLIACLAAIPSSAAAVSRDFFGVVTVGQPTNSDFQAMGRGKVGTLRELLFWATVEPTPGARNWGLYDELVANASAQGVRVLPVFFGSPGFASPRETRYPIRGGAKQAFARFVTDAVNRYKPNGTFWQSPFWNSFAASHPGATPIPITAWQLWNEVNSPSYSTPHPNPRQFGGLVKLTGAAVHSADPSGQLILPGMFTRPSQRRAIPLEAYLKALYKVKGIQSAFDGLAVHPYAHKAGEALKTVKSVRRVARRHGDGGKPIWVTELGWASSGTPSRYTTSPTGQAGRLTASFNSLAGNAARLGIAGVYWYSFADASPGGYWLNRTGLFELNRTPKPSWSAFVSFTGGQP
jgi:hypothetical protein